MGVSVGVEAAARVLKADCKAQSLVVCLFAWLLGWLVGWLDIFYYFELVWLF